MDGGCSERAVASSPTRRSVRCDSSTVARAAGSAPSLSDWAIGFNPGPGVELGRNVHIVAEEQRGDLALDGFPLIPRVAIEHAVDRRFMPHRPGVVRFPKSGIAAKSEQVLVPVQEQGALQLDG